MTRYLVLEVVDKVHDLADLLVYMRRAHRPAQLHGGGYALDVVIGELVTDVGQIKGTDTHIYVTEGERLT